MRVRDVLVAVVLGMTGVLPLAPVRSALAQDQAVPLVPILTIDQDRLFSESRFGKAVSAEYRQKTEEHIAENRRIEAQLETEERDLTLLRGKTPAVDFEKLAADFDAKVEGIRSAQDGKSKAMTKQFDADRQRFFEAAKPVLGQLMSERGAGAIIDKRAIFLGFESIDLTDAAIARLDQVLGNGTVDQATPEPVSPADRPAPVPATP